MQIVPDSEHIFRGNGIEKVAGIRLTNDIVMKEMERLKKFKSLGPDKIYPRILKGCQEVVSGKLWAREHFLESSKFRRSPDYVEASECCSNFQERSFDVRFSFSELDFSCRQIYKICSSKKY